MGTPSKESIIQVRQM